MSEITLIIIILASVFLFFLLSVGLFVLKVFMIVDAVRRPLKKKVKWIVINAVVPFGYVFYYFMVKRKNIVEGKYVKEFASLAMISAICGIVSSFLFVWLGIMLGVTAIICGVVFRSKNPKPEDDKLAKAGIILGSIGAGFQVLFVLAYFGFIITMVFTGIAVESMNETGSLEPDWEKGMDSCKQICLDHPDYVEYKVFVSEYAEDEFVCQCLDEDGVILYQPIIPFGE